MPGERRLREAAERRQQKAQMAMIENHLKKLQDTDDLSYSDVVKDKDLEIAEQIKAGKKLIDDVTLARLIDECK
jgi:hypothetical protein